MCCGIVLMQSHRSCPSLSFTSTSTGGEKKSLFLTGQRKRHASYLSDTRLPHTFQSCAAQRKRRVRKSPQRCEEPRERSLSYRSLLTRQAAEIQYRRHSRKHGAPRDTESCTVRAVLARDGRPSHSGRHWIRDRAGPSALFLDSH